MMPINDLPPTAAPQTASALAENKPAEPIQQAFEAVQEIFDKVDLSADALDEITDGAPAFLNQLTNWLSPAGAGASSAAAPAAPAAAAVPAASGPDSLGLRAKEYGRDGGSRNPASGDDNWYMSCLGWTNQAFRSEGKVIPELQAADAKTAFRQAEANGKVQYGSPPPGAIVFYPEMSQWGHVGIVNEDGTTYRGTVSRSESRTTLGDRPIPSADRVAWMLPE